MLHILKSKSGQYYWLAVGKKANTYEELAKDTEFHTQKHNVKKNLAATMKQFKSGTVVVIDHTVEPSKYFVMLPSGDKEGIYKTGPSYSIQANQDAFTPEQWRELKFLWANLDKFTKL